MSREGGRWERSEADGLEEMGDWRLGDRWRKGYVPEETS